MFVIKFLLFPVVILLLIRSYLIRWGLRPGEPPQDFPGKDILSERALTSTRAITIRANRKFVWPWLVQMGQDKGGFYSYSWLENSLLGLNIQNADQIIPDYQNLKKGDVVYLNSSRNEGCLVTELEREEKLVLAVMDPDTGEVLNPEESPYFGSTWAFFLREETSGATRLFVQTRVELSNVFLKVFYVLFLDHCHFLMEWKMLRGIRRRAEKLSRQISKAEYER